MDIKYNELINELINEVKKLLYSAKHAVFFGGAGVSTDSGIPDFRGTGGMYNGGSGNEYYLSRDCLVKHPDRFYKFYKTKMLYPNALPNTAHKALAELEKKGVIKAVITQNIDALHQKAGSENVIELHGNTRVFYCSRCGAIHSEEYVMTDDKVPLCIKCGGVVRPDITLYGEALDAKSFAAAEQHIQEAGLLVVGGTSLTVHPAASLVEYYDKGKLVIVNYSATPYDSKADYVLNASVSQVLEQLAKR